MLSLMLCLNIIGLFPTIQVRASGYDPSLAVEYAHRYAYNYNSEYSNYNSIGGDCANFVSQCLYAGGLEMTDGWYWYSYSNRSGSWASCPDMYNYFKNAGYQIIENPSDSELYPGNPVLYYSSLKGRWSHAAICVGHDGSGNALVSAHNADHDSVNWKLGSDWSKRCTILINNGAVPPGWANVSITKQHFKTGEEVVFTLTSDRGNSYTVGIDDESGNRIYTHNTTVNLNSTTQYYTHIFDKGGNYSCYITTYNDYGLADSGRIYFTVYENKPGYAKVSLDRASYKIGEEVTFKLESDTGNSYTVGIDDADGNRLYTKGTDVNLDTTTRYYTHVFDKPGQYSCYITTYNDIGLADSERIYFSIYDAKPGWAKVELCKSSYKTNESVSFNLSSDTGNAYTVGIDTENSDGTRTRIDTKQVASNEKPIYARTFDEPGQYSCYITTYNDIGLADSERIFFSVYNSKPGWAKVSVNSDAHGGNVYKIGQEIHFSLSSDTGYSYTVGIDTENADGTRKRIDTKQVASNEAPIYTRSFDIAGNYSCYITTYNDFGLADSERIFFTIYDHKPDWAKVTINSDTKNGMVYDVGEEIHFNLTSNTGFSYTVGIDKEKGERKRIDTQQIGIDDPHTYTRSFNEPGKYSCYITTYNDYGLADSERIFFTISPVGDCNADGDFNISDVVLLQKWLLAVPDTTFANWQAADMYEDGRLDVFDLCLMKCKLING